MKPLAYNRRAKYDYEILETFEAGLILTGSEVKSIKTGHLSLKGSYVTLKKTKDGQNPEAYLINAQIPAYQPLNAPPLYDGFRSRKLLLKKKELKTLIGKLNQKGLTLVPIKVYTKRRRIKLEFGLGKGKKKIDKREAIKKREVERKIRSKIINNW